MDPNTDPEGELIRNYGHLDPQHCFEAFKFLG
jgi:hypothetical protein